MPNLYFTSSSKFWYLLCTRRIRQVNFYVLFGELWNFEFLGLKLKKRRIILIGKMRISVLSLTTEFLTGNENIYTNLKVDNTLLLRIRRGSLLELVYNVNNFVLAHAVDNSNNFSIQQFHRLSRTKVFRKVQMLNSWNL